MTYRENFISKYSGVRRKGYGGYWYRCANCGCWCGRPCEERAYILDDMKMDINDDKVNLAGIFIGAKIKRISLPAGHLFNDKKYGLVPNGNSSGYWHIPKSSTSYRAYALPTSTAGLYLRNKFNVVILSASIY